MEYYLALKRKENLSCPMIWMNLEDVMLSGLPCPPSGGLPGPGIKPTTLTSPALAGGFFTTSATWEAQVKEAHHEKTNTLVFHLSEVPKRVELYSRVIIVRVWGEAEMGSCSVQVESQPCKMKTFWSSVVKQCTDG